MVLPIGETRVSNLPKGNLFSQASSEFDSLSHTTSSYAGKASVLENDSFENDHSVFQQTDVGLTDPRLVRNTTGGSKDEFRRNEMLNNLSAKLVRRSGETDVGIACEHRGGEHECKSSSLEGRFARACLLRDTSPPDASYDLFQNSCGIPSGTSQNKTRCSSDFSDGQESLYSVQSELETPNDGSWSDSVAEFNDIFPDVSEMSVSVEEQTHPSLSELDSAFCSSTISGDCVKRNFRKDDDSLRCKARKESRKESLLVQKTPEDVAGDFDVYNIETTLPYMDWDYLEDRLQKAIEKEEMSQSQRNDREKIRQKLAMGLDDEHFAPSDRLFKKPSLQTRLNGAKNLQMCFVNEGSNELAESVTDVERKSSKDVSHRELSSSLLFHSLSSSLASSKDSLQSATMATVAPPAASSASQGELNFFSRQARLQAEARLALAQVRPMAHMQLQLEKQTRRKSPIADIMGIPGFGDGKNGRLTWQLLRRMNLGQLQVVVNDMHAQIEAFNTELMELLIERDDLHMAQDSMLVDIEDLTRRAQEYDVRMKSKLVGSQNSC